MPAKPKIIVKLKPYTMERTDINKKVGEALEGFGSMPYLSPTEEWNNTLISKLNASHRAKRLRTSHVLFIIFIALILGGNVAFGLKMLSTDSRHSDQGNRLEAVSNEFLINSVSAKN